jgi:hypothetical protein
MKHSYIRGLEVRTEAPDVDCIGIALADYRIIVERDEAGEVSVVVLDDKEGSATIYVLGQEGYTQKV